MPKPEVFIKAVLDRRGESGCFETYGESPGLCVPKSLLSEPSPDSILLTNANPNHGIIIISFWWIKKMECKMELLGLPTHHECF
jgi:hypothetical protein